MKEISGNLLAKLKSQIKNIILIDLNAKYWKLLENPEIYPSFLIVLTLDFSYTEMLTV